MSTNIATPPLADLSSAGTRPLPIDNVGFTPPTVLASVGAAYVLGDADADAAQAGALSLPSLGEAYLDTVARVGARVNLESDQNSYSATHQVAYPSGISPGDLLLCWATAWTDATATFPNTPSGWLQAWSYKNSGTYNPRLTLFWKIATGTESGNLTVTCPAAHPLGLVLEAWSGVDEFDPFDAGPSSPVYGSNNPNPAAVTTVTDGAVVLVGCGFKDWSPVSIAPPTNYTESVDTGAYTRSQIATFYRTVASAGSEDPGAASANSDEFVAVTIALKPATVAPERTLVVVASSSDETESAALAAADCVLAGRDAVQTITSVLGSGSFTLTFNGQTTASIAYNAAAAAITSALEALSNIAPGEVRVTGGPLNTDVVYVEFIGGWSATDVPVMTTSSGSVTVVETVSGLPAESFVYEGDINVPQDGSASTPQVFIWSLTPTDGYLAGRTIDFNVSDHDSLKSWAAILQIWADLDTAIPVQRLGSAANEFSEVYFTEFPTVGAASSVLGPEWEIYDSVGNAGFGVRSPGQIEVVTEASSTSGGEVLRITAENVGGEHYSGGLKLLLPYTNMRAELRVRVSDDASEVTSGVVLFWPKANETLFPSVDNPDGPWPAGGEVDIWETFDNRDTRTPVKSYIHKLNPAATPPYDSGDDTVAVEHIHYVTDGVSGSGGLDQSDWHKIVCGKTPDEIWIEIDNGERRFITTNPDDIPAWPMELCIQLDAWSATPPASPVTMDVDYVFLSEWTPAGTEVVGSGTGLDVGAVTPGTGGSVVLAIVAKALASGTYSSPNVNASAPGRTTSAGAAVGDRMTLDVFVTPPVAAAPLDLARSAWSATERYSSAAMALRPAVPPTEALDLAAVLVPEDLDSWVELASTAGDLSEVVEFDLSGLSSDDYIVGAKVRFAHAADASHKLRVVPCGITSAGVVVLGEEPVIGFAPAPLGDTIEVTTTVVDELVDGTTFNDYPRLGVALKSTVGTAGLTYHRLYWVELILEVVPGVPVVSNVVGPASNGDPITWAMSSASGNPQTHYQVRLINGPDQDPEVYATDDPWENSDGNLIYDSGMVADSAARSLLLDRPLGRADCTVAVRAWTRLAGRLVPSDWATANYDVADAAPSAPSSSAAAALDASTGTVTMSVTLDSVATRGTLVRSVAGTDWEVAPGAPVSGSPSSTIQVRDLAPAFLQETAYRVVTDTGPHSEIARSPISTMTPVPLTWYFQSLTDASLNLQVDVVGGSFRRVRRRVSTEAVGVGSSVVVSSPELPSSFALQVRAKSKAERDQVNVFLALAGPFRLATNLEGQAWTVAVVGDVEEVLQRWAPLPAESSGIRDAHYLTLDLAEVSA